MLEERCNQQAKEVDELKVCIHRITLIFINILYSNIFLSTSLYAVIISSKHVQL